jgi:hypothetical protein
LTEKLIFFSKIVPNILEFRALTKLGMLYSSEFDEKQQLRFFATLKWLDGYWNKNVNLAK